jgi:putative hydrolase of the HAD superfamily
VTLPRLAASSALLLDLDDTILDDRSGLAGAWQAATELIASRHADLGRPALSAAIDDSTRWFWSDPERERRGRLDLLAARREIVARALAQVGCEDAETCELAARRFTEQRERAQRLADGALAALVRLRRRFPRMALVTNGAAAPQRAKIQRFGLAGYFDHIQIEGEFGLGKPEPRVFEHVLRMLGREPSECLMVGDNWHADVLGALALGLHAAWIDVAGQGQPPSPAPRAHARVRSLAELADRLEQA